MIDERDSKLVLRAEASLGAAALREADWDALATRVDGALLTAGPTDDSLLLPPLPESIDDGHESIVAAAEPAASTRESDEAAALYTDGSDDMSAAPAASQRESTSLADLARATVARRSAKEAVDLAKESLAIASQGRGVVKPVVAEPVATILVEREDSTFPSARRQRALERAAVARSSVDRRGPWIGVAIAAVGLAAGFGLYLTSKRTQIVEVPVAASAAPQPLTPATVPASAATNAPEKVALAAPALATGEPLPAKPEAAAETPSSAAAAEHSVLAKASATATTGRNTPSAAAHAEKIVLDEEHPTNPSAAAPAKPAASAELRPAELNTSGGGISDRPSTGAAQAAVGAVLGAARACLAGQPAASSATLIFGSNGEVSSVNVSGPAAGSPAADCIKGALGKARVQPFAAKSFSLGVTVRPL